MKKIFMIIVAVLLFACTANAAPFLVSDPAPATDEVTNFKLIFDGGSPVDTVPVAGAMRYDLSSIAEGSHTVVGQACNVWGCSANSLPFVFNKKIPGAPGVLRIVP
jgi:hypothetical protein